MQHLTFVGTCLPVLRLDGPSSPSRALGTAAPVAISLRSIHAFGVTATAKAAYAMTGMFFIFSAS